MASVLCRLIICIDSLIINMISVKESRWHGVILLLKVMWSFKAVSFVPPKSPHDLHKISNLKSCVRCVFISDEFDELLPKYLNLLRVFTLCDVI